MCDTWLICYTLLVSCHFQEFCPQEIQTRLAHLTDVETELHEKAKVAASKDKNKTGNRVMSIRQRGALLTQKYKGEEFQESDDDEVYVITSTCTFFVM